MAKQILPFADFDLCSDLIAKIIFGLLPEKTNLKLVIDRTNWKFGKQNINIFMLGITYRNVAFPLLFMMLDKQGNSNSQERIALIKRFVGFFGKKCIDCILADREFVGEEWIKFLNEQKLRYYIRIRNNFKVFLPHKNSTVPVSWLFNGLKVGQVIHYPKIVKINGEYCYLSATLTQKRGEKPELLIIISYNKNDDTVQISIKFNGENILDLGEMYIDNTKPTCTVPENFSDWGWFSGSGNQTISFNDVSEVLDEEKTVAYVDGKTYRVSDVKIPLPRVSTNSAEHIH